ncbi:MAG: hypothetical protein ACK41O_27550, partial [Runella zeae]
MLSTLLFQADPERARELERSESSQFNEDLYRAALISATNSKNARYRTTIVVENAADAHAVVA